MRVQRNDIAFTPEAKQAIIDVVAIERTGDFAYNHNVLKRIQDEFVKLTANSFGIIPASYTQMDRPANQTAITKARLIALGGDRIAKCKRFMEVVPNTSGWGLTLCEEGKAVLEELNLDENGKPLPYSDRVDEYDIKRVLENVLGRGYDNDLLIQYNTDVKKKIKKSKYLKKVPAGDPLRAGLSKGQVCYEFTDAMFDDHIDVFTDVLFIGHQLRVVRDEDGMYMVQKLCGDGWNYVTYEDKLYDVIVHLPNTLKHNERRAVERAVCQAERGGPIKDDLFTTAEVRQLAEFKGVELPAESTFSVVEGHYEVVQCDKVKDDDVVVARGLNYNDAEKLRVLIKRDNEAKRDVRFAEERIKTLEKELEEKRAKLIELEAKAASTAVDAEAHKQKVLEGTVSLVSQKETAA